MNEVSLRFILNGIINQKKVLISYDLGLTENHKIICNMEYQKDFIEKEYDKISKLLNIHKEYFNIWNFSTEAVQYELLINENFTKNNDNIAPFISTDSNFEDLINKLSSLSTKENSKINAKLSLLLE